MTSYRAPIREQLFVLETIADIEGLSALPGFEAASLELSHDVLSEAAKLAETEFASLNRIGDTEGARWSPAGVSLPSGFGAAYRRYAEGGWNALGAEPKHGGQGLPFALSIAVQEQFTSANMALSLCTMLSLGAIEALQVHGSAEQQNLYLPRLVSGEWTGTMNLTEPQAGSDVGALRTAAVPAGDGTYRLKGSKIFISWGEHDLTANIVHLVLARLPDASAGTKGISLFLVPKFIPDAAGVPGQRNDVRCVSIERKLGMHASPTCTMSFGDHDGCIAWLVGAPHAGMQAMFTMMNHARVSVGLEGVAIAERATQGAFAYARDRVQSVLPGTREPVAIIRHPDVRRMLMTLRSTTEAVRAITYFNAATVDRAHATVDPAMRAAHQARADLLTPITKAYATDMGVEMASLAIQVFGGMGYVEETGAAQHLRDARVAAIYEGTNGIQAMDLVGRKLRQHDGQHVRALLSELASEAAALSKTVELVSLGGALGDAVALLDSATGDVRAMDPLTAAGAATPYLRMFGIVLGAVLLGRQARIALARLGSAGQDDEFLTAKLASARFFIEHILPQAAALRETLTKPVPYLI